MLNVAVCVSGGGTNLQAILDAVQGGRLPGVRVCGVVSNNPGAFALERARKAKVEAVCVSPGEYPDREAFYGALLSQMRRLRPDLIVLAGFLVTVPVQMVREYAGRILNVHPSLIPSFCGPGYYGLRVHEAALARGVRVTGATVHFVDEHLDTGPILLQKAVEVRDGDTPRSLQRRVMEEAEWKILPAAIGLIAQGRVRLEGGKAVILPEGQ